MHFAERSEFGADDDPLMALAARRRAAGELLLDLTESNPTRCGLGIPSDLLTAALADPGVCSYHADPFGPVEARQAIAKAYYQRRGIHVRPEAMFLNASTSEAYGFLFRLLCEPGDHVLVPQPSYPLFDMLAQWNDVEARPYALRFHDRWQVDLQHLEAQITPQTRAIVIVHPNNPTGHFTGRDERLALFKIAQRFDLPLVVDEVFLDYGLGQHDRVDRDSFAAESQASVLTFLMSGLSKVLALPQMKLAWTVVDGPSSLRTEALRRLELLGDTYLSVGAPVSRALPAWLSHADSVQTLVRNRLRSNLDTLDAMLGRQQLVSRLPVEGGWSVLLRIPALAPDQEVALNLLLSSGVLVHPGSFFGLPLGGWLVASLLPKEDVFCEGMRALLESIRVAVDQVHTSTP